MSTIQKSSMAGPPSIKTQKQRCIKVWSLGVYGSSAWPVFEHVQECEYPSNGVLTGRQSPQRL